MYFYIDTIICDFLLYDIEVVSHAHTYTHPLRQSYDVDIDICLVGEGVKFSGSYDLKNPNFRYMTMPPPPPSSQNVNPTEAYFEPSTSSNNSPYAHGGMLQATAVIPHSPQIVSPTSAGGTVVVSAMTPHPVMAVHATPPGVNGVSVMNGGLLGSPTVGHAHNHSKSREGAGGPLHRIHAHTQPPLLQSPPPSHSHVPPASPHGHVGGGLIPQAVSGGASHHGHQSQYVYASAATAVGTMGNPHFVYKYHQVHHGAAGRPYSTY